MNISGHQFSGMGFVASGSKFLTQVAFLVTGANEMKKNICPICKTERVSLQYHTCDPVFKCWVQDNEEEEDATEIRAYEAEEAARDYAEQYDGDTAGECWFSGDFEIIVNTLDKDENLKRFEVTGELTPYYRTHEFSEEIK